jgi:glycerate 2-kinase
MNTPPNNKAAEHALAIYHAALGAVRADALLLSAIHFGNNRIYVKNISQPLNEGGSIYVVGAGKAAASMAAALEERLGDRITDGVVVTKYGHGVPTRKIKVLESAHPVPDENSVNAGRAIIEMVQRAGEKDVVIFLLSGGASALMELPQEGITLEDLRVTTDLLLRAGAPIEELNTVRACLSQVKAGGIARAADPAWVLCLALSDVLGNPLNIIGSGPCMETPVDAASALDIIRRHGLEVAVPERVLALLEEIRNRPTTNDQRPTEEGERGKRKEERDNDEPPTTQRPNNPATQQPVFPNAQRPNDPTTQRAYWEPIYRVRHVIIGDIWTAVNAAKEAASKRGLRPKVVTGSLQGEAREAGRVYGGIGRDMLETFLEDGVNCFIAGGETTVTVRGQGKGGRSQELACAAAPLLEGIYDVALLAAGTDGTDGPTDAAGGLVDGDTMLRALARGVSLDAALQENDCYTFLEAVGGLIKTGPTHSNVGDLIILVMDIGKAEP